jgi:UDP-3-O-[3-hydroxymyristoyl] N-acetylglucosamine deacetylase
VTASIPSFTEVSRNQHTLKEPVLFSGIGLHTGRVVSMRFCPAKPGTGIVFCRTDLPAKPIIPARIEYVIDTARSTTIGIGDVRIHTVEHVLAAVRANEIDNLIIEISGIEPPVGDGSSSVFVDMIRKAGIEEQSQIAPVVKIQNPVYWAEGEIQLVALPYDGYRVSYTLSYPENEVLRSQFYTLDISPEAFNREIAPCRTFSLYEEVSALMDRGLIKGGSLDNATMIKGGVVFSKGGLHFPNEMARHKILDLVGDLSLVGFYFHAHIIAIRSGHGSNVGLAGKIYDHFSLLNSGCYISKEKINVDRASESTKSDGY